MILRKKLVRVVAGMLSGALILTSSGLQTLASETDTGEVVLETEDTDTVSAEEVSDETDTVDTESGTAESETSDVQTDDSMSTIDTGAEESSAETDDGAEEADSQAAEQHTITGFVGLSDADASVTYFYSAKPTEEDVSADLPDTLEVYLDGSDVSSAIPVTWQSMSDYEDTSYYWYAFEPVWDESEYTLDCEDDIPYVNVNLTASLLRTSSVTSNSNETTIYKYLTETMGLNTAAACGVLANIFCESSFNPTASGDNGNSYGICQWYNTRKTSLINYCNNNNLDYTSIEGQLAYLNYELTNAYSGIYTYLKGVSNDAQGAYDAAYYWCYYYEIPADTALTSEARGYLARDTYWPAYSGSTTSSSNTTDTTTLATISGQTTPGTLTVGNSFTIKGTISSKSTITSVTVAVYDTSGTKQIGKTVSPNSTSYSLSNVDSSIKFGTLSAGVYTYKVTATNSAGTATLVSQVFIVLSTSRTVSDGTYYIVSKVNSSYCLSIKSDSGSSGANVHLWTKKDNSYMKFKFVYQSNGYYKIQDVGSGKYLSVANSSSSSGANVQQSSTATLWQVLSDGAGSYYLVPKCGTSRCMDLKSGKAANGQNIQTYTANLTAAQRWMLTSAVTYTAPTISGQTTPGTLTAGNAFTIKGTISSNSKITSVTVGVYDTSGNQKIGKTVSPNATSYSLSKVDSSIKFGTLSAGVYTYKVTATNSWGTKTLVSKVFIVLSTGKTVSNGTYYISTNVNTKYCLSIKSDSNSSGANVHLWTKKSHSYMRFKFVYQSNGYYKIQDVGSGKYLSVANSSSSSGANVQQSSSATLWQVLPDGTGSYYIVPKCGTSRCLDLKSASAANGQNIQIYTANLTKAQRWKLTTS